MRAAVSVSNDVRIQHSSNAISGLLRGVAFNPPSRRIVAGRVPFRSVHRELPIATRRILPDFERSQSSHGASNGVIGVCQQFREDDEAPTGSFRRIFTRNALRTNGSSNVVKSGCQSWKQFDQYSLIVGIWITLNGFGRKRKRNQPSSKRNSLNAEKRTRTSTPLRGLEPESSASANSAISAKDFQSTRSRRLKSIAVVVLRRGRPVPNSR